MALTVLGFPHSSAGKESAYTAGATGDTGLVPGLGNRLQKEMAAYSSILA